MSLFEFITTLFSIVLALSVARVLSGFVGLIEFHNEIEHPGLFFIWLFFLLMAQIVWWFSLWGLNSSQSVTLGQTLFVFQVPVFFFVASWLLVPAESEMRTMSERFNRLRVPFLLAFALPNIPGPLSFGFITGEWFIAAYLAPIGFILIASTPFKDIRVQYCVVLLCTAIYLAFAVQYRAVLTL